MYTAALFVIKLSKIDSMYENCHCFADVAFYIKRSPMYIPKGAIVNNSCIM